jgi:hypothetical protein
VDQGAISTEDWLVDEAGKIDLVGGSSPPPTYSSQREGVEIVDCDQEDLASLLNDHSTPWEDVASRPGGPSE